MNATYTPTTVELPAFFAEACDHYGIQPDVAIRMIAVNLINAYKAGESLYAPLRLERPSGDG